MKTRITVITDIFIFLISFIMFLISMLSMKYFSNSVTIFQHIFDNTESDPMEKLVAVKWNCPSDYKPLFSLYYEGINSSGCYCSNTSKFYIDEDCEEFLYMPGYKSCKHWDQQSDSLLKVWQNKTICYKSYNMSNVEKMIVSVSEDCPAPYTNCGYYDLFKDKLCLRPVNNQTNWSCPINHINITSHQVTKDDVYEVLKLSNTKSLVYSNLAKNTIPTGFVVSEGPPCILKNRISNYSDYFPFSNISDNVGCDPFKKGNNEMFYDNRYILLDTYNSHDFFNDNDLNYMNELPQLPYPYNWTPNKTMTFNLYYKTFTRMDADCLSHERYTSFVNYLEWERILQFILLVIYLFNIFSLGIFNSLLLLMKINSKFQNFIVSLGKLVVCIAVSCGSLYIVYNAFQIGILAQKFEETILSNVECLDMTTKFLYSGYYKIQAYINYFDTFNRILFYCSFTYTILVFIQLMRFIYKSYFRIVKKLKLKDSNENNTSSINK